MTDTTPMPVPDLDRRRPALIGRFTATLADLLAAGALVLGIGLALSMLVLPAPGDADYDATSGPGWPRVVAHLVVGIVGEVAGQLARRRAWPVRVVQAVLTVAAVLAVLTLSWWR